MKFQEYPKKMHHPEHAPAVWKQLEGKGTGLFAPDTVCINAERFPEVTVTNLDQERYYASRGYRPNNMPDPVAYEQAILDAQPQTGYQHQEYPKWKYHALEIPVIVKSAEEEEALGAGWHDHPVIATEDDLAVLETNAAAAAAVETGPAETAGAAKRKQPGKSKAKAKHTGKRKTDATGTPAPA